MNNNTFIITTTTYPSRKKLCYTSSRSVFTPDERISQMHVSIESVLHHCPSARIVWVENGQKDVASSVPSNIDYYYAGKNFWVRRTADCSFKGLGESVLLLWLLNRPSLLPKADLYFKMSGRYFLTEQFDIRSWERQKMSFLFYGRSVSTRLYSIPAGALHCWRKALFLCTMGLLQSKSIEDLLPKFIPNDIICQRNQLGVSGYVAPTGEMLSE